MATTEGETLVGEGVTLRYLEAGTGDTVVLLPGWSQTAALFGADRVSALVLVDQMACALRDPQWTDEVARLAGATMDAADLIYDVATHDWRHLIPSIDLPTLVVAGNSADVPVQS